MNSKLKKLQYYIIYLLVFCIAVFPFKILYFLSDFMFVIIYYVVRYRKSVVIKNLHNSFPEKSDVEIKKIAFRFYRNFCDIFVETLKALTITEYELREHITFDDAILKHYHDQNKSVIVVMAHLGNWEYTGYRIALQPYMETFSLYKPLTNKVADKLLYHIRTRGPMKLYDINNAFRNMLTNKDKITQTVFATDQSPSPNGAYWTTFLNQNTAVFTGPAKIAKKLNYPIVFLSLIKVKRGKYTLSMDTLVDNPKLFTVEEITEKHVRFLEKYIKIQPEIWLWSHKRWKHKRPTA